MWAWFCSVERSVLGKCLLCLITYLCVFMKHSLCESNIDLLSLSTWAFYFTVHCRHVRHSKKFKYREKYIGPKGENKTSSCSYSFALFCWSNMMKQGWFFTLYPLEFLESVRWNEKKKIKWKQIVHFWINLPSSTLGPACRGYDGQVSVGSFLNSPLLMDLRRHLSFQPHLISFVDYNRE